MIREIKVVVGARRESKDQTRRMCKLVLDGESRGRLSLSMTEAAQLARMVATSGQVTIDN